MTSPSTGISTATAGPRSRWRLPDAWTAGVVITAALLALPVLTVFSFVFYPAGEVWTHLVETVLADYVRNSLALMVGVGVGTLLMGVTCAWLTSVCDFPGRRLFEWALLLPMAIPAYIIAFTYTGMLGFEGPVQSQIREWTGWGYGDYWFPEIRSLGGAIAMLSLVLYPYVYLLARAAFLDQSVAPLEVGRTLGAGRWRSFFTIALPLARPAVIAGVSLALMETLADYGTVQYFGVSTFTTGIFRTWFGLGDGAAAAQLSAVLMSFVLVLILIELWSRRRARFHQTGTGSQRSSRVVLVGVMLPFTRIDNAVDSWMRDGFGISTGLLLSGTVFALLFAYSVRFLAVALNSVESGLARIRPNMDHAARSLGQTPGRVLRLRFPEPVVERLLADDPILGGAAHACLFESLATAIGQGDFVRRYFPGDADRSNEGSRNRGDDVAMVARPSSQHERGRC